MIRLLNAGVERLRKNKAFWLMIIFGVVLALFMIYTQYIDMTKYNKEIQIEQLMVNYSTMIGIVIAIFTSLFLGVEYSDGAIRNKISIGHKRANIYLSNLIIIAVASLLAYILYMIILAVIGIQLFGGFTRLEAFIKAISCIAMAILCYASIFTFIAMLISNKTITAIVSIMLVFIMMMVSLTCLNILDTPEFVQTATMVNGETKLEKTLNPKYPSEAKKQVCQTILDILPSGQAFQVAGRSVPNLLKLPLYSLAEFIVITSVGIILFNRKELK